MSDIYILFVFVTMSIQTSLRASRLIPQDPEVNNHVSL
jgi:hypothetical protein